jgi:hypothetical protein
MLEQVGSSINRGAFKMFRLLSYAILQSIVAILASDATAGCRQDPREARLGEAVAKFKTYNCDSGIKVEFYQFSNQAAATLASGRTPGSILKTIGKPEFIRNAVFNKLKYMVDKFGSMETTKLGNNENTGVDMGGLAATVNGQSYTLESEGTVNTFSVTNWMNTYPAVEILELNKHTIPDNINVYYTCSEGPDNKCRDSERTAVFWRYATANDITNFKKNATLLSLAARANKGVPLWSEHGSAWDYSKSVGLLQYLAGSAGLPEKFLILSGGYRFASSCSSEYWDFSIITPMITLEAVVIRNDKARPLRVDSVRAEEIAGDSLRVSDDAAPVDPQPISLGVIIPPGNALAIPTRIVLKSADPGNAAAEGPAETYRRLRSKGIVTRANVFAVPEWNNYVFGPELKVAGLVVDGNAIKFGEKSQNFMDIAFSGGGGSCPYLLSWDNERADWTQHGKVLHEANDISREETETITLPGFVSRFRVEEREPEVATIDNAEIALSLKDGRPITLRPDTAPSVKAGRQLLFWGDAQELEFSLPSGVAPADVVESKLSLTGYYERYSGLPNADRGGAFVSDAALSIAVDSLRVERSGPICRASATTSRNVSTAVSPPANFAGRQ